MRWTKAQLLNSQHAKVSFDEMLEFGEDCFTQNDRLIGLKDVHVSGEGYMDAYTGRFVTDFDIDGVMICPCAITNEEVEVPFETSCHEVFSFEETEELDVHVVKNGIIELIPVVFRLICLEVPLKVVKDGPIDYPHGDGWEVFSEEDYQKKKDETIDPRLAKLKDFKFD